MTDNADLIEVYSPQDPAQVTILKQLLTGEGIDVYVVNDGLQGVMGEIPFNYARPRIWVKTTDALAARDICMEFDQRLRERTYGHGTPVNETLFCYHCGETLSAAVDLCPSCDGQLT